MNRDQYKDDGFHVLSHVMDTINCWWFSDVASLSGQVNPELMSLDYVKGHSIDRLKERAQIVSL